MTSRALLAALGFAASCFAALACRRSPAPRPYDERGELLERILKLPDVEPCLADAGTVRLVDADLAGEAAAATFVCTNGAARGRVTFFRVAGQWTVSTKAIEGARDR